MKYLILSLLLISCTQKYQTYHIIDANNFDIQNPTTPITKKMYPARKVTQSNCEDQWLFNSNAQKENQRYVQNSMIKRICETPYLLNARLTETWWTTIIYSRSCFKIEGYCPKK